jgi:hypothetical protein
VSEDGPQHRLDPDRAASEAARRARRQIEPVIDTKPYRRIIGGIGIGLAIVVSAALFITRGGVGTVGVQAGSPLHQFVAPLAQYAIGKRDDANLDPRCDPAAPNGRALNICHWYLDRRPLVLGFFVTASSECLREIDTLQTVSREFSPARVNFAAVGVRVGQPQAAALVRSHHWTIPIAYDADGAVGDIYGIDVCPIIELTARGGVVERRAFGDAWVSPAKLAAAVRTLLGE